MNNLTTQFTKVWLPGMLIGASLMLSVPSHAAVAATPQQPATQTRTAQPAVQVAWDRVGSPVRSFV